jgi:hypothetical protein
MVCIQEESSQSFYDDDNAHYACELGWWLSSDRAHRFGALSAQAADSVADVSKVPVVFIHIYIYIQYTPVVVYSTRHIYNNYYIILWYTV